MDDYKSEEEARNNLEQLQEYKEAELAIIADAEDRRYQLESQYAELTRSLKEQSLASELTAYKSASGSVAKLLGIGIKAQATIMIPFEIAEATKDMAKFLSTRDPSFLAASLKHALAAKQYADAAKTAAHAGSIGGGGGEGGAAGAEKAKEETKPRAATVVVNVGDGVVVNPKEFTRQLIEGLNEAYRDNVKIEFAN